MAPLTRANPSTPQTQPPVWSIPIGLIALGGLLALLSPTLTQSWPATWNFGLRQVIDNLQQWIISNRSNSLVFIYFIEPIRLLVDWGVRLLENGLLGLHWAVLIGLVTVLGQWLGGWRLALFCAISFFLFGLFGLWNASMQTLALMLFSVLLSVIIGIGLGIGAAMSDRFDRMLRPILDTMQTMPAFVFLIPVVVLFGVARVPAVIATIIYAIPPVVRLTNLGIREVSPPTVEAARAFGSTHWQLLGKVLLPLALPALLAGINQTIMMALGMVAIAAMVGAGGLGDEVYSALKSLKVGQAFEAGLSIVLMAIALDRLSEALSRVDFTGRQLRKDGGRTTEDGFQSSVVRRLSPVLSIALIVLTTLIAVLAFQDAFPDDWRLPLRAPIDLIVRWMRDNLFFITGPISDNLTRYGLNPTRDFLSKILPWPVLIGGFAGLAYFYGNWRLALGCALGLLGVGWLGMWEPAMDTLSQVLVTLLVTALIALPLGVLASQYGGVRRILRPIMDFLQTVPTFVFLVPVLMLFNIGRVPGLIASVLYAIPVGIKLTELGIRQVSPETVEAARAFGSTRGQIITKVQLPLARKTIALAINQMIMMVLAMVIIAGMVGGAGLGLLAVEGLARNQVGKGMEAGIAIVILAIIMDRLTQAWAARSETRS